MKIERKTYNRVKDEEKQELLGVKDERSDRKINLAEFLSSLKFDFEKVFIVKKQTLLLLCVFSFPTFSKS